MPKRVVFIKNEGNNRKGNYPAIYDD